MLTRALILLAAAAASLFFLVLVALRDPAPSSTQAREARTSRRPTDQTTDEPELLIEPADSERGFHRDHHGGDAHDHGGHDLGSHQDAHLDGHDLGHDDGVDFDHHDFDHF